MCEVLEVVVIVLVSVCVYLYVWQQQSNPKCWFANYRCSDYKLDCIASHSDNLRAGIHLTFPSVDSLLEDKVNGSLTSVHDGSLKNCCFRKILRSLLLDDSQSHQIDKTYHHTADIRTFLERNNCRVRPSFILEANKERHRFTRDLQIKQGHLPVFPFSCWMNAHDLY